MWVLQLYSTEVCVCVCVCVCVYMHSQELQFSVLVPVKVYLGMVDSGKIQALHDFIFQNNY